MAKLSDESKDLIRREQKKFNEEEKKTLDDIWEKITQFLGKKELLIEKLIFLEKAGKVLVAAHVFLWTVILSGFIASIFLIPAYLDRAVAQSVSNRMQIVDRFSTAIAMGYTEDWDSALSTISVVWNDIEKNPDFFSRDFIHSFYGNLLWILSSANTDLSGNWIGEDQWKRLQTDKLYQESVLQVADDANAQLNLARCELKYSGDAELFERAADRMKAAYKLMNSKLEKAVVAYLLGLHHSALDEKNMAKSCFRVASQFHPGQYRILDWEPYYGSFVNDASFLIWSGIYRKRTSESLADFVSGIMKELATEIGVLDAITENENQCIEGRMEGG